MTTVVIQIKKNSGSRNVFYRFCKNHNLNYEAIEFYSPDGAYHKNTGAIRAWAVVNGELKKLPYVFVVSGKLEAIDELSRRPFVELTTESSRRSVLPAQGQSKKDGAHSQSRHS
jgi:hypothetical protein